MNRRVAAVDAVHGIKHRGVNDRRHTRGDQRRGATHQRRLEQHLVPIRDLVRRCRSEGHDGTADGQNGSHNERSQECVHKSPLR